MNPNNPLAHKRVIPAQAGIQLIEKSARSGSISSFCPLRGTFLLLDSRLRGNDEANGLAGMKLIARFPVAVLSTIRTVGAQVAHGAEEAGFEPQSLLIRTVFK